MAGITASGLGSGLDITGLVQQLVAAEGTVEQNRLNNREIDIQTELSGISVLKGAAAAFQDSLTSLQSLTDFASLQGTSTDYTVFNVDAFSGATPGNYSLEIQKIATSHKVSSSAFSTKETVIGTGEITFEFGTFSGGTFTINADKISQTVDLNGTDGSLNAIRDAVNEANIGVSATIINDGSGFKLIFTSTDTGASNSLRVSTDDDDGTDTNTSGLSQLAYDPAASVGSGKNMTETVTAEDSTFILDGTTINTASNSVTDVIEGVTITLKKADSGTSHTIAITESTSAGKEELESFIEAYNDLNTSLRDLTKYDPETGQKGILFGDFTARSILNTASASIATPIDKLVSDYSSLASVGVKSGSGGVLSLDSTLFDAATDADPNIVARLFSKYGKPTDSNVNYVSSGALTPAQDSAIIIDTLATQGDAVGGVAANLTISSGVNDTIEVSVDGTIATVTLTAGTYASATALAAEVQNKINSNTNLTSLSKSVSVAESSGVLTLTSNAYGSSSSVTINGGNGATDLMGASPTETSGVDMVGTIGGQTGTASGRFLTSPDSLKIEVLGSTTGSRGRINYTIGLAETLDDFLDTIIGDEGIIEEREDSLNDQLDEITDEREDLSRRLTALQASLTSKFTALDQLLIGFQQTSNFLTSALSNLPSATSNK